MVETIGVSLEAEEIRRLACAIKNREPNEVRFYRHIALLVSQNIRDFCFVVYLDGRTPLLYQRENGGRVVFGGDVSDAYKAFETMIPNFGTDDHDGTFSKEVFAESWEPYEKNFYIEARFNCCYVNDDYYEVTIRFNTKTVDWTKGTLE
jgi:hypothetical protein